MTAQFYLAINMDAIEGDESTAAYLTEGAAMTHLDMAGDATNIYLCTPDENRMRDVTEDLAWEWWLGFGYEKHDIPRAYQRFLEDAIAERDNIERVREERGAFRHLRERAL